MYWARMYELLSMNSIFMFQLMSHREAYYHCQEHCGPGFLNGINRYYNERLWR